MLDLVIVLAFVVYAVSAGLRARSRASRSLQEYFLAGKEIRGWKAGLSMAATQFAADTPLLVTGLIATAGIFALWRLWIYGIAFLLLAFVFAVGWRRSAVLTDAELTEIRYSGSGVLPLRVLKAIYYGTVINCVVMAMVLVAAIRIAEVFLPWHEWLPAGMYEPLLAVVGGSGLRIGEEISALAPGFATTNNLISILLILTFTTAYSATGGLRAVINTDVAQFGLAMVGTFAYAWVVIGAAGGLRNLPDAVADLYGSDEAVRMLSFGPPVAGGELLLPFLMIIGMQWFFQMNSDGTGYLAQRSMACRTDRDARVAGVVFTWAQVLFRSLLWLAIGVGLLVLYPFAPDETMAEGFVASREILFVQGISDLLPPGIRGLMLVGLLAALASTLDTHLNWGASYWSNDVYDRLVCRRWLRREPRNRELVVVARLSNLLIMVIALAIMANLGSIQTAWFISLLFGAGMGSVLVLRWLWERINLYSELAAMGVSLVTAPLLLLYMGTDPQTEWIRLGIMALVTTTAAIAATFVTPKTSDEVLVAFYERVHPFGVWNRTAALAGHRPRAPLEALGGRLLAVAITAVSLFLVLAGIGRLAVPAPGSSVLLSWLFLAGGLVLVPIWWRSVAADSLTIDRGDGRQRDELAIAEALAAPGGIAAALRASRAHLRDAYGLTLEIVAHPGHEVARAGQRQTIFEVVEDLLLHLARAEGVSQAQVEIGRVDGEHRVRLLPGHDGPPRFSTAARERALQHDREALGQIGGRLELEELDGRLRGITLRTPVDPAAGDE
jgi:solute:Na+ symporter, SSS family